MTSADSRADTWLRSDQRETKLPQEMPDGTVTVLFTDVEGCTHMTSRRGDAAAREILRAHFELAREQVREHGGVARRFKFQTRTQFWHPTGCTEAFAGERKRGPRPRFQNRALVSSGVRWKAAC